MVGMNFDDLKDSLAKFPGRPLSEGGGVKRGAKGRREGIPAGFPRTTETKLPADPLGNASSADQAALTQASAPKRPTLTVPCRECDGQGKWYRAPFTMSEAVACGNAIYIGSCDYCEGLGTVEKEVETVCMKCGWMSVESVAFCWRCGSDEVDAW